MRSLLRFRWGIHHACKVPSNPRSKGAEQRAAHIRCRRSTKNHMAKEGASGRTRALLPSFPHACCFLQIWRREIGIGIWKTRHTRFLSILLYGSMEATWQTMHNGGTWPSRFCPLNLNQSAHLSFIRVSEIKDTLHALRGSFVPRVEVSNQSSSAPSPH